MENYSLELAEENNSNITDTSSLTADSKCKLRMDNITFSYFYQLLSEFKTLKAVAEKLEISDRTLRNYFKNKALQLRSNNGQSLCPITGYLIKSWCNGQAQEIMGEYFNSRMGDIPNNQIFTVPTIKNSDSNFLKQDFPNTGSSPYGFFNHPNNPEKNNQRNNSNYLAKSKKQKTHQTINKTSSSDNNDSVKLTVKKQSSEELLIFSVKLATKNMCNNYISPTQELTLTNNCKCRHWINSLHRNAQLEEKTVTVEATTSCQFNRNELFNYSSETIDNQAAINIAPSPALPFELEFNGNDYGLNQSAKSVKNFPCFKIDIDTQTYISLFKNNNDDFKIELFNKITETSKKFNNSSTEQSQIKTLTIPIKNVHSPNDTSLAAINVVITCTLQFKQTKNQKVELTISYDFNCYSYQAETISHLEPTTSSHTLMIPSNPINTTSYVLPYITDMQTSYSSIISNKININITRENNEVKVLLDNQVISKSQDTPSDTREDPPQTASISITIPQSNHSNKQITTTIPAAPVSTIHQFFHRPSTYKQIPQPLECINYAELLQENYETNDKMPSSPPFITLL
ncbi:MAG: hypothetical protein Tsb005_09340 [Gammaproteobacteria bacterium]